MKSKNPIRFCGWIRRDIFLPFLISSIGELYNRCVCVHDMNLRQFEGRRVLRVDQLCTSHHSLHVCRQDDNEKLHTFNFLYTPNITGRTADCPTHTFDIEIETGET